MRLWRDERKTLHWDLQTSFDVPGWEIQFDYGPDEWHPVDSYTTTVSTTGTVHTVSVLIYGPDFLTSEGVPQDGLGLLCAQTCRPRFRVVDNPNVPIVQGSQIALQPLSS